MNQLQTISLAFLLVLSAAAAAQDRVTDTAFIQLVTCPGVPNVQVVMKGKQTAMTHATKIAEDQWKWTQSGARFSTNGSVASIRIGTWRSHCRRSEYYRLVDQDVAKFTFECDEYPQQQLHIISSTDIPVGALRILPSADRDKLDAPCREFDIGSLQLTLDGLRLPSETVLLRFRDWKGRGNGPALRVFEKTNEWHAGVLVFDPAVRAENKCRGKQNAMCLTRDALARILGTQRLPNAQAVGNAYDIDMVLNAQLKEVTFTVK